MALVEEKVKEEDRELFNSFVPNRQVNRHTKWVVDREKNIYSFWVCGDYRDYTKTYFMSWNNIKKYIYKVIAIIFTQQKIILQQYSQSYLQNSLWYSRQPWRKKNLKSHRYKNIILMTFF